MPYRDTHTARQALRAVASRQGGYVTTRQTAEAGYGGFHLTYHVSAEASGALPLSAPESQRASRPDPRAAPSLARDDIQPPCRPRAGASGGGDHSLRPRVKREGIV